MRSQSLRDQGIRYLLAAALSALVSFGVPITLHELFNVDERVAVAAGLCCVIVLNFFTTRKGVFRSRGRSHHDLARYLASVAFFRGLEYLAFLAINSVRAVPYYVALALVLGTSAVLKFFVFRHVVYRPAREARS